MRFILLTSISPACSCRTKVSGKNGIDALRKRAGSILLIMFLLGFGMEEILPCAAPTRGYGARKEILIRRSGTILLVTAHKKKFLVKEVLSGDQDLLGLYIPADVRLAGVLPDFDTSNDYSNHFQDHSDPIFWRDEWKEGDIGRSPFPCCVCNPLHEFIEGHDYLLFPENLGAMKSAERIRSKEDKWYQYVLEAIRSRTVDRK